MSKFFSFMIVFLMVEPSGFSKKESDIFFSLDSLGCCPQPESCGYPLVSKKEGNGLAIVDSHDQWVRIVNRPVIAESFIKECWVRRDKFDASTIPIKKALAPLPKINRRSRTLLLKLDDSYQALVAIGIPLDDVVSHGPNFIKSIRSMRNKGSFVDSDFVLETISETSAYSRLKGLSEDRRILFYMMFFILNGMEISIRVAERLSNFFQGTFMTYEGLRFAEKTIGKKSAKRIFKKYYGMTNIAEANRMPSPCVSACQNNYNQCRSMCGWSTGTGRCQTQCTFGFQNCTNICQ